MYIKCPDGYKLDEGMSARLMSDLYGTRQGAALWSNLRTKVLKKHNCKQSLADPSLYTPTDSNGKLLVTCIVDDFVITGDTASLPDLMEPPFARACHCVSAPRVWHATTVSLEIDPRYMLTVNSS